jgi:hypothetical protein
VTLYDQPDSETSDTVTGRPDHGRLDAGEAWEWAVTFGEKPDF